MLSATVASRKDERSANIKQLPRSGTVRTNGQELFYQVHGDGPALVLVMGIGYDSSLWTLQQVPVLCTRFRVVILDNRDAGRSARADQPYTIPIMLPIDRPSRWVRWMSSASSRPATSSAMSAMVYG